MVRQTVILFAFVFALLGFILKIVLSPLFILHPHFSCYVYMLAGSGLLFFGNRYMQLLEERILKYGRKGGFVAVGIVKVTLFMILEIVVGGYSIVLIALSIAMLVFGIPLPDNVFEQHIFATALFAGWLHVEYRFLNFRRLAQKRGWRID